VAAVIDRCLAKRRDDRYANGEELAEALGKALADASREARVDTKVADVVMSEDAAQAIWRRAAQLQAETLQRLDTQRANTALVASSTASGVAPTSGYRLDHVRQAALEAGISGQFFDLAMAELPRGNAGAPLKIAPETSRLERNATAFLGTNERSLSVSKIIDAPPALVLQALGSVWRLPPYALELRAPIGGHPLDGGILVFDLPGLVSVMDGSPINPTWYATRHTLEATQLQVTLKPVAGRGNATEVTVFCDLRPGIRRNVLAACWMGGGFGGAGSVFAALVAVKKAVLITMFTATAPAVIAGLAITGATIWGYRTAYRWGVDKSRKEITKALDAIEGGIQSEALFGPIAPAWRDNSLADPMRRGLK
jgi:hypothetical protein